MVWQGRNRCGNARGGAAGGFRRSLRYWLTAGTAGTLPTDHSTGDNTEASARTAVVSLAREETLADRNVERASEEAKVGVLRVLREGVLGVLGAEAEVARLYDEGSFAAIRFAITRITDFELRPRGASVYRDYRRFLDRGRALDELGPRGVRTFLGW